MQGRVQKTHLAAVILAGGRGTRMQSEKPKVLHTLAGRPMIYYSIEKLLDTGITTIYIVVGFKGDEVKQAVLEQFKDIYFAHQQTPKGTGDAVNTALKILNPSITSILVVNGDDSAFYAPSTLKHFISSHKLQKGVMSVLTLKTQTESKLGRIIRDAEGNFDQILEHSEYDASGLQSDEINCGAYIFDVAWLKANIDTIPLSQKGEYYLTELLNIAHNQNKKINLVELNDVKEWIGINTQEELQLANNAVINLQRE